MKSATKIQKKQPYNSQELDAFLSLEETIDTEYIRTSMMLAAQIEDAMIVKGIGKKKLADMLGKKPSVITKWLSGTHNFETNTLTEIAKVLEIKIFAFDIPIQTEKVILNAHITLNVNMDSPINIPNTKGEIYGYFSTYNKPSLSSYNSITTNRNKAEA
jgi:ribosome-binding protein aMBF1 (putative translation factor)